MKGPYKGFFYKEEDIQNDKNSHLTAYSSTLTVYLSLIHTFFYSEPHG